LPGEIFGIVGESYFIAYSCESRNPLGHQGGDSGSVPTRRWTGRVSIYKQPFPTECCQRTSFV